MSINKLFIPLTPPLNKRMVLKGIEVPFKFQYADQREDIHLYRE